MSREFYNYKRGVLKTARELLYSESVINRLKNAKTESEISRIMATARKEL